MGGGSSSPKWLPAPAGGYTSDPASCPPIGENNYIFVMSDGKEIDSYDLDLKKHDNKPIVIGRSASQGSTIKSNDDNCSACHLEINWNGTNWTAKDMDSSRGSRAFFGTDGEMVKIESTEFIIPGPGCINIGEVTFITFIPKKLKAIGIQCTLNELADIDIKQGQFMELKAHTMFGRAKDQLGRKTLLLNHENISGTHCVVQKPTGGSESYAEVQDLDATHKTVVKMGKGYKMKKDGSIAIYPGMKLCFGHKEKTIGSGKLEFTFCCKW